MCFCFSSLSLSSSAVEEDYLYTADDLIDLGFIDIGQGSLGYFGYEDPFDSGISLFSRSSKNFSDFDVVKSIPWSTFPNYIMEIMEMSLDDFAAVEGSEFKTPFVCVQVEESGNVNIWAGINVGLGTVNDSSLSFSIYGLRRNEYSNAFIFPYSCLYRYAFNYKTGKVNLDWTEQVPTVFGNYTVNINDSSYPNLYRFAPWNLGNQTSKLDFYLYGGNGVYYSNRYDSGTLTSLSVRRSTSDANAFLNFTLSASGFRNGNFLTSIATNFSENYFQFFEPLSREQIGQQLQQEQNETSKSIWETLKGIPEAIGEKIKSLFVPKDGFFDTYIQSFQDYFKDRFGILYEIPELVISILQKIINLNPKESDYEIAFPQVKLPILVNGEWSEKTIIDDTSVKFDFLENEAFSRLINYYHTILWLTFIFLLINLIIRKANSIFKGGSG